MPTYDVRHSDADSRTARRPSSHVSLNNGKNALLVSPGGDAPVRAQGPTNPPHGCFGTDTETNRSVSAHLKIRRSCC